MGGLAWSIIKPERTELKYPRSGSVQVVYLKPLENTNAKPRSVLLKKWRCYRVVLFLGAKQIPDDGANEWKKNNQNYPENFFSRRGVALNRIDNGPNVGHKDQDANYGTEHGFFPS
jgi:hypothetical protein